jgi:hypothetical protein
MAKQTVALYTVTSGDRVERARSSLAEALGGATLGDPNDAGVFEVSVDAESPDAARDLVREAFARAGTGDDFVLQETTEGREIDPSDPRQGPEASERPDPSARVADAASAVAAAAGGAASSAADAARTAAGSDAADSVREAATGAASSAREAAGGAADSVREAVDEKGFAGAASDYASTAADAAKQDRVRQLAPIGALLLLLLIVRRRRR